jgi:hypothetical protein
MWYHRHLAAAEDFGDYAMPYGEGALIFERQYINIYLINKLVYMYVNT